MSTKNKVPPFTQEQFDWMLALVAFSTTTIHSSKEEHVAEVVKRDVREKIRAQMKRQGYLV